MSLELAQRLKLLLTGGLVMACWVAALFFLRFWRETRDRLFAAFALAFGALSLNWLLLALWSIHDEARHYLYLLRLLAFLVIVGAIVDKNRRRP